jgi:hypothetical protein
MRRKSGAESRVGGALLYIKRDGRWQNAAYQQSPAPRQ